MTRSVCGDEVSKLVFTFNLILSQSVDTSRGEDAAQLQPRGKQALLLRPGPRFSHN